MRRLVHRCHDTRQLAFLLFHLLLGCPDFSLKRRRFGLSLLLLLLHSAYQIGEFAELDVVRSVSIAR